MLGEGFDKVTDQETFIKWNENILSTFFVNKEVASKYIRDSDYEIEDRLMQKVGQDSLSDPSFVNKLNTGIY